LVGFWASKSLRGICSAKTLPRPLFSREQKGFLRQLPLPFAFLPWSIAKKDNSRAFEGAKSYDFD